MQKIHQGQDIISLYSIVTQSRLGQNLKLKRGLIIAAVSAFFITGFLLVSVNYMYSIFSGNSMGASLAQEEVAFIPGSFIRSDITKGYIGK